MRFLIIFTMLFVLPAHARHNPKNPSDYRDPQWVGETRECGGQKSRMQSGFSNSNQTAIAAESARSHIEVVYRSCLDRATRVAKQRHRPTASAPKPDSDQAPAPESQTVQPPEPIPSIDSLAFYQNMERVAAKAARSCTEEIGDTAQAGRKCANFINVLQLFLEEQKSYFVVSGENPPPSVDRQDINAAVKKLRAAVQ